MKKTVDYINSIDLSKYEEEETAAMMRADGAE